MVIQNILYKWFAYTGIIPYVWWHWFGWTIMYTGPLATVMINFGSCYSHHYATRWQRSTIWLLDVWLMASNQVFAGVTHATSMYMRPVEIAYPINNLVCDMQSCIQRKKQSWSNIHQKYWNTLATKEHSHWNYDCFVVVNAISRNTKPMKIQGTDSIRIANVKRNDISTVLSLQ